MSSSAKYAASTAEDQVLSLIGLSLLILVLISGGGYWIYQTLQAQEAQAAQSAAYRVYERATAPTPAIPAAATQPPAIDEARRVREKLLAHPGVTPGPGFMRPGVQSTGSAIVDAIDLAQAREKAGS